MFISSSDLFKCGINVSLMYVTDVKSFCRSSICQTVPHSLNMCKVLELKISLSLNQLKNYPGDFVPPN